MEVEDVDSSGASGVAEAVAAGTSASGAAVMAADGSASGGPGLVTGLQAAGARLR